MGWTYLFIAAFFEVTWAIGLKYSDGFSKLFPSIITVIAMIMSYVFLTFAIKYLPLGTAYAVWTGIGVIGTAIWGIAFFNESGELLRVLFILFIIIGIVGLKLTSAN